jgi:hypothetical protein
MVEINLGTDEYVVLEVRRSLIVFSFQLISYIIGAIIPLLVYAIFSYFIPAFFVGKLAYLASVIYLFIVLNIMYVLAIAFTNYYLDYWVLTNERLVAFEQKKLFSRLASTLNLDKIQDIQIDVRGVINTFLHIGMITVQTASEDKEFILKDAARIEKVKAAITEMYHKKIEEKQSVVINSTEPAEY